jgi:hypothetical protein
VKQSEIDFLTLFIKFTAGYGPGVVMSPQPYLHPPQQYVAGFQNNSHGKLWLTELCLLKE